MSRTRAHRQARKHFSTQASSAVATRGPQNRHAHGGCQRPNRTWPATTLQSKHAVNAGHHEGGIVSAVAWLEHAASWRRGQKAWTPLVHRWRQPERQKPARCSLGILRPFSAFQGLVRGTSFEAEPQVMIRRVDTVRACTAWWGRGDCRLHLAQPPCAMRGRIPLDICLPSRCYLHAATTAAAVAEAAEAVAAPAHGRR